MSSASVPPFETILKLCLQSGGEPWYPGEFADSMGIPASRLAAPIDELQSAGLIEATGFRPGRGPGYRLTRAGIAALQSPEQMAQLRAGELPGAVDDSPAEFAPPSNSPRATILAALSGHDRPIVTYAILAINVLLFFAALYVTLKPNNFAQRDLKLFLMMGNENARHRTGAVTSGDLVNGQWWRLVSTMFVHKDLFHLFIVMSAFLGFARRGEQLWGPVRFAMIYLISGLAGSSVTLLRDPTNVPAGAEGAVCGMLASMAIWFLLNKRFMPTEIYKAGLRQILSGYVWFIAWAGLLAFLGAPRLSWNGYVAGTVVGAIVAIALNLHRFTAAPLRWVFAVPVVIVPLVCVGLLVQAKRSNPKWRGEAENIVKKRQKSDDIDLFNNHLSNVIAEARRFSARHWESIGSLCDEKPDRRGELVVAQARDALRDGRAATERALAAIKDAGIIETERVADVVGAAEKFLQEQLKLIELAERCLVDRMEATDELNEQAEQTLRSMRIYDKK